MNKPIRILNTNFDIQGEINDYESMFFTRSFSGIGSLELRINRHKLYANALREGNIIVVDNDYRKTFVIKNREIELSDSGKLSETWLIKAHELKTIVAQRITMPPAHTAYDNKSGNAETVMKHYINTNIVNPTDTKRSISNFVIAENQNRGQHISHQSRFKNLADEMNELSTISGLGWIVYIYPVNKQYVFDCLESRDLTANQSANPPVIFSPEFDSVKSLKFMESKLNYKNTAIVAGQGEGIARSIVEVGSLEGLERHEVYIDARDISAVDENQNAIPQAEIEEKLAERGNQKLAESKQEMFLEGQILTNSPFSYGTDYDLGDIVTIQNKDWGVTMDARITEIKEIYEKSGFRLEATFGNSFPTLIQKIKQEFKQTNSDGYITKAELLEEIKKLEVGEGGESSGGTTGTENGGNLDIRVLDENKSDGTFIYRLSTSGTASFSRMAAGAALNDTVQIPDYVEYLGTLYMVTVQPSYTILKTNAFTKFVINIHMYTMASFSGVGVKEIDYKNEKCCLQTIPTGMFYNSTTLERVKLPPSVQTIGSTSGTGAFQGCTNLKSVDFSGNEYLTTLGTKTFYGCTGLTSIVLPKFIKTMGTNVFEGCAALETVVLNDVQVLNNYTFKDCEKLKNIDLSNVNRIYSYTFQNCVALKSVENALVESIGSYAFLGCTGLEFISFSAAYTYSNQAFKGCINLRNIVFGQGNASRRITINSNAFENCTGLTELDFSTSKTASISSNAFLNCTGLRCVRFGSEKPSVSAASFTGVTGCTFVFQKKSHYTSLSATSKSSFRYWIEKGEGMSNTVDWIEEDV